MLKSLSTISPGNGPKGIARIPRLSIEPSHTNPVLCFASILGQQPLARPALPKHSNTAITSFQLMYHVSELKASNALCKARFYPSIHDAVTIMQDLEPKMGEGQHVR